MQNYYRDMQKWLERHTTARKTHKMTLIDTKWLQILKITTKGCITTVKRLKKKKNYKGPPSIFTRTPVYYYNRRGKIVNLLFKAVFTICIANHFRSWDVRAHVWVREGSIGSQGDVMVSGWGWENMETARARFGVPTHHTRYWDPVHRQKTK